MTDDSISAMAMSELTGEAKRRKGPWRLGWRFKRPLSPESWVISFVIRFLMIAILSVWWFVWVAAYAFIAQDEEIGRGVFLTLGLFSVVPVIIAERMRRAICERAFQSRSELVELEVSADGMRITSDDAVLWSKFANSGTPRSMRSTEFKAAYRRFYTAFVKRMLDIALVVFTAPFAIPVILLAAVLISLEGGRPFYVQTRVGRRGRLFRIWRLRTIAIDAHERLEKHLSENPAALEEWVESQRLDSDPRITMLGRFLLANSIDELPQLFNVLKGDMSIVGPQPISDRQYDMYSGRGYYAVRPGLTGLWQLSEHRVGNLYVRARFDDLYYEKIGILTDLKILGLTVATVFRRTKV